MIPSQFDESDSTYYRFLRSLPAGSLPLRRFSLRPHEQVEQSSGLSMFGAGVICGALLIAACLAVA